MQVYDPSQQDSKSETDGRAVHRFICRSCITAMIEVSQYRQSNQILAENTTETWLA
jgi:hypothetical protein